MRLISLRLDDATDAALRAYCDRHGVTQTDAVKRALASLSRASAPSPALLARELGLIGAFDSGQRGKRKKARG